MGAGVAGTSGRGVGGAVLAGTVGLGFAAGLESGLDFLGGVPTMVVEARVRVGDLALALLRVTGARGGERMVGLLDFIESNTNLD